MKKVAFKGGLLIDGTGAAGNVPIAEKYPDTTLSSITTTPTSTRTVPSSMTTFTPVCSTSTRRRIWPAIWRYR